MGSRWSMQKTYIIQLGMYIPSPRNKRVFLVGTGACAWGVLTCLFVVSRYRGPTVFFACGALLLLLLLLPLNQVTPPATHLATRRQNS